MGWLGELRTMPTDIKFMRWGQKMGQNTRTEDENRRQKNHRKNKPGQSTTHPYITQNSTQQTR